MPPVDVEVNGLIFLTCALKLVLGLSVKCARRMPPPVKLREGSHYDSHVLFACALNAA